MAIIAPFSPKSEAIMLELAEIDKKQEVLRERWFARTGGMKKRTQTEYNLYEELQERRTFLRKELDNL